MPLQTSHTFQLLVTATNSEDSLKTASTILHINVENLDDNQPEFLESVSPLFQIEKNTLKPIAIGRLSGYDADGADVFYHILPSCGSEYASNFSIDPEFGELVYHPQQNNLINEDIIELCILASSIKNPDLTDIFFDSQSKNMKKIVVNIGEIGMENPEMYISGNDTVVSMGDSLQNVEIPMQLNMIGKSGPDYQLESLNFVPANYELGRDIISPEGSVEINPKTGEIVANGRIVDTPQGVFVANIERDGNRAVKQLHHIKNDRKLRYRLAMSRNEFGANVDKLKRQIHEALESDSSGKRVRVYFDEPKMDSKNSSWTSVCFYITRDNAILDDKQMHSMISNNNGHISKLHHIFKVQDVNECAVLEKETKSSEWHLPQNTIILIGVVALLILLLITLLVYVCCVARYRRHLEAKAQKMKAYQSSNYYKSPNFMAPPGYIATSPPIPPPVISFY